MSDSGSRWTTTALQRVVVIVALLANFAGCDPRPHLDGLVEDVWLKDFQPTDAVKYFQSGGKHYDMQRVAGAPSVDSTHVLPLVEKLAELKTEPIALIDEDNDFCWVILVKLPGGAVGRSRVQKVIEEADRKFPGIIETEWGAAWLAINFEDERQAAEE